MRHGLRDSKSAVRLARAEVHLVHEHQEVAQRESHHQEDRCWMVEDHLDSVGAVCSAESYEQLALCLAPRALVMNLEE